MESCGIFKSMKASKFDLCHFYQVGDFPKFPKLHKPATSNHIHGLLEKACKNGYPNLIVALSQDAVTSVLLLKKLHASASLWYLKMETPTEVAAKLMRKLSSCSFCQYCNRNDPSYLNHITCAHYNCQLWMWPLSGQGLFYWTGAQQAHVRLQGA